jgi:hypothetical protein
MNQADGPTPVQVDVARIFFGLKASEGFLVAGGAALLASELITRPTTDLDLFASSPVASVTTAKQPPIRALGRRDFGVAVIQDSPTFCRMVVDKAGDQVLVDLAIDSPPHSPPTMAVLGPTLAPVELAGRKLLALFGRAEARDPARLRGHLASQDLLRDLDRRPEVAASVQAAKPCQIAQND